MSMAFDSSQAALIRLDYDRPSGSMFEGLTKGRGVFCDRPM